MRLVRAAEGLVSRIAGEGPTVLVIDDVQWADLASRDALTYLIAGFGSQPLVVLRPTATKSRAGRLPARLAG